MDKILNKDRIMGYARAILAFAGGILTLLPFMEGVDLTPIIDSILIALGAILELIVLIWSGFSKKDDADLKIIASKLNELQQKRA